MRPIQTDYQKNPGSQVYKYPYNPENLKNSRDQPYTAGIKPIPVRNQA